MQKINDFTICANILFAILFCFLLNSCSPPVQIYGDKSRILKMKNIGLLETIIAPETRDSDPFFYRPSYIAQTGFVAALIDTINYRLIDSLELCVKESISQYKDLQIFKISELNQRGYGELAKSITPKTLKYHDPDFPSIIVPKGTINLFAFGACHPFKSKDKDSPFFDAEKVPNQDISKICKELKLDGAIITVAGVKLETGNIITRKFGAQFHFYDSTGIKYLTLNFNQSDSPWDYNPEDILEYKARLSDYKQILPFMIRVLRGVQENTNEELRTLNISTYIQKY